METRFWFWYQDLQEFSFGGETKQSYTKCQLVKAHGRNFSYLPTRIDKDKTFASEVEARSWLIGDHEARIKMCEGVIADHRKTIEKQEALIAKLQEGDNG